MFEILAEVTKGVCTGVVQAIGCFISGLGVMMIGMRAVEAVGRNPGAAGKLLVQSILGMALAEAITFYVLFLA
ncbi:MAG: ATP synthase F0 subunit C [Puniceicoccales bacterium]|jgi:F-type H+-transporting ATPase subunit c|nr:ATP synthase F0 subunit C [Puniceicoccales bacterium]